MWLFWHVLFFFSFWVLFWHVLQLYGLENVCALGLCYAFSLFLFFMPFPFTYAFICLINSHAQTRVLFLSAYGNCRCGHEFCYSCGAGYSDGQQTCQCAFWDGDHNDTTPEEHTVTYPTQEAGQWAWDSFDSLPMIMDAYSDQERSQLALIQRFLLGGFSLSDHNPCQSPPRCTADSYTDAMKDLHQLPWLERFVSVISDNNYDDYVQWRKYNDYQVVFQIFEIRILDFRSGKWLDVVESLSLSHFISIFNDSVHSYSTTFYVVFSFVFLW